MVQNVADPDDEVSYRYSIYNVEDQGIIKYVDRTQYLQQKILSMIESPTNINILQVAVYDGA